MYVLSTGCQWRYVPKDLPPRSAVNGYFCVELRWTLEKIHHALYQMPRASRPRSQPDRLRDRQPERKERGKRGPASTPGLRCGQAIKGKKRHILVDTLGLLMHAVVHRPMSRIATAGSWSWPPCSGCSPFWRSSSPTAAIRADFQHGLAHAMPGLITKSSNVAIRPKALSSAPALDRRAHDRLAQPLSPARQGLGKPEP